MHRSERMALPQGDEDYIPVVETTANTPLSATRTLGPAADCAAKKTKISASLRELRAREQEALDAAAREEEAERAQRLPMNRERVGFRQEKARQKQVGYLVYTISLSILSLLRYPACDVNGRSAGSV